MEAAEGAFGPEMAKQIVAVAAQPSKVLGHISVSVLQRMEALSDIQQQRVLTLVEKEQVGKFVHPATNEVILTYRQLLLDLQKIRFDLGLDDFKGPVTSTAMRGATQQVSLPDGTNIQRQVFEAVSTVEQIFDARKIPLPGR
jgi:hypothetical protein